MPLKYLLKQAVKHSPKMQRIYRLYRSHTASKYLPEWKKLIGAYSGWQNIKTDNSYTRVLLATSTGGHPTVPIMDSILSVALTLRNTNSSYLLCDGCLPACQMTECGLIKSKELLNYGPSKYFCKNCYNYSYNIFKETGTKIHKYSEYLDINEINKANDITESISADSMDTFILDGINIGEHAKAGALRYFAVSSLEGIPNSGFIFKLYLKSAIITYYAIRNLIKRNRINVICLNHGIYIPHGIIAEVGRKLGCRIITWNIAYRSKSFIFSHDDTYHHTLLSEPTSSWENMDWSKEKDDEIMQYLRSRQGGGRDWIVFQDKKAVTDISAIIKKLPKLKKNMPCVILLTNVAWDAQLHYPANAFKNMMEWIYYTIDHFIKKQDIQLLIRIHPAELSGDIPSRQPVLNEIKKKYNNLPNNIIIIAPGKKISTYALMDICDCALIYGTKTGVELTSRGIPVIVAGEAWIRNKNLTIDVKSPDEYSKALSQIPFNNKLDEPTKVRAKKYAYHFFFRRMIPINSIEATGGEPKFKININDLSKLGPGNCKGLDVICDGIINNEPFVYDND